MTWSWRLNLFLAGQAVTRIGSWATAIAIWGFATFSTGADARDIALLGLVWAVPALLVGPFVGVPIDRFGPRPVLIASELVGLVASLALITTPSYGWVLFLSIGHGFNRGVSFPALDALPPRIVADEQLATTNALLRMTDDLSIVIGPVVGAVTIQLFGFGGAFAFDALTYLGGLLSVLWLVIRELPPAPRTRFVDELGAGVRLVRQGPALRRMFTLSGALYGLWGASLLLEPLYVRDVLGHGVGILAALQTSFGLVLVAGGVVVARMGDRLAVWRTVALAVVASGLGAALYLGTSSIVAAFAGVAVWGGATAFFGGPSRTLLQRNAPESAHGRVLALDSTMESLADVVAMAVVGPTVALVGVRGSALVLAGLVVATGLRGVVLDRPAGRRRGRVSASPSPAGG